MILLLLCALLVTVILGGMRSLSWASSAEAIAAILALIVPVAIVAVMVTNFPLPQLTHGPLLRALVHSEAAQGLAIVDASASRLRAARRGLCVRRQALHRALRHRRADGLRLCHADRDGRRRRSAVAAAARLHDARRL